MVYDDEDDLVDHWRESDDHVYCDDCERLCESDTLDEHYANSHQYCTFCKRNFVDWKALQQHEEAVHVRCQPCNLIFSTTEDRRTHWHESSRHHHCGFCSLNLGSLTALQEHRTVAHAPCRPCDVNFKTHEDLVRHWRESEKHVYCALCKRLCESDTIEKHYADSSNHNYCTLCSRDFVDSSALDQHQQAVHAWCHPCMKYFSTTEDRLTHWRESSRHHYCTYCNLEVANRTVLRQHRVAVHSLCLPCNLLYETHAELVSHWRDSGKHIYCTTCKKPFDQYKAVIDHYVKDHHYCRTCRRCFDSKAQRLSHPNCSIHKPVSIKCPHCDAKFGSASALTSHLEGGGCPSGWNRRNVDRRMRQMDINHLVTRPTIEWNGVSAGLDYDDVAVTHKSYNPFNQSWACPLCTKSFATEQGVNSHLNSGCRDQKQYRCPNTACGGYLFTRLSALVQHIESNKCRVGQSKQVKQMLGPRGPLMIK